MNNDDHKPTALSGQSGDSEKKETSNSLLKKENIIFEHEDRINGIESVFFFKDGDILIFKNTVSVIYDGKTFKEKIKLTFLGALCAFCYLSEEEFILIKDEHFALYTFKNERKTCEVISKVYHHNLNDLEKNKNIFRLSNDDLINIRLIRLEPIVKLYRRVEDKNKCKSYELIDNNELNDIDEVINLEKDQFLTIKKFQNLDQILFKVYSNKDYSILTFNRINCRAHGKRRIFFSDLPFFKVKKNKLFMGSISYFNLFDIDTLELETTINISPEIRLIQVLNNNCVFFVECDKILEGLKRNVKYDLTKVIIDFESNDIIKKESNDITDEIGEYKTLFNIFNYLDNGLATITDNYSLKIYKNLI